MSEEISDNEGAGTESITDRDRRIERLEAENERLRERLDAIEDAIETKTDSDTSSSSGPNTDGNAGGNSPRVSRRGALATLATLGLLGTASQPASAATPTLEFGGNYTSDPGSNYGLRLAPTGSRFGLLAFSSESNGRGVVGRASSSTGTTIGVLGRSDSSTDGAAGLQGFNDATSGRTYGFKGRSDSPEGRGALGIATANSGNTIGLEGRADSTSGVAVKGTSTTGGQTAETYGVQGISQADGDVSASPEIHPAGVYGQTTGTSRTFGVRGDATSTGGTGVYGNAAPDSYERSWNDSFPVGMTGLTTYSSNTTGLFGAAGVEGAAVGTSGTAYGVLGINNTPDGYAVYSAGDAATTGNQEVSGNITQSAGTVQKTAGPIAKGNIASDGTINTAVNVDNVSLDTAASNRYTITLTNTDYQFNEFVTSVTPYNDPYAAQASSVGTSPGKLAIFFEDDTGSPVTTGFSFVTFGLPSGATTTSTSTDTASTSGDSTQPGGGA